MNVSPVVCWGESELAERRKLSKHRSSCLCATAARAGRLAEAVLVMADGLGDDDGRGVTFRVQLGLVASEIDARRVWFALETSERSAELGQK
jgi:hypothetical protein